MYHYMGLSFLSLPSHKMTAFWGKGHLQALYFVGRLAFDTPLFNPHESNG